MSDDECPTFNENIFSEVAEHILLLIQDCFECHGLTSLCDRNTMQFQFSHNRQPADCCGFTNVFVQDLAPGRSEDFPFEFERFPNNCEPVRLMVTYGIQVRIPCYPIVGGGELPHNITIPESKEIMEATRLSNKYGRVLWCCLENARKENNLTGLLPLNSPDKEEVVLEGLQPYGPDAGCYGWDMSLKMLAPGCC